MLSPILVILACQATARLAAGPFGDWAIYPWLLVYWAVTGFLIYWGAGASAIRRWAAKGHGHWLWIIISLVFLPITFPIFQANWPLIFSNGWLWLPWLIFPLVNSFFEEGYWRGLLMDTGRRWPAWAVILYTTLFFSLNHLSLGAFVKAYASPMSMASPVLAGVIYGLVYWKTGSLRWPFISHTLVNWISLGILVLMNIYVPPMP